MVRVIQIETDADPDEHELDDPDPRTVFFVATVNGHYAGYATLIPSTMVPGYVYMSWCGVEEEFRGQGIQRRLIRYRVRWARKYGFKGVYTYTYPDNPYSANNLIACGFRVMRSPPHTDLDRVIYWSRST